MSSVSTSLGAPAHTPVLPLTSAPATRPLLAVPLPPPEAEYLILDERLAGEAARQRSRGSISPDLLARIEYVEVWRRSGVPAIVTIRMYDFGGRLVASRTQNS